MKKIVLGRKNIFVVLLCCLLATTFCLFGIALYRKEGSNTILEIINISIVLILLFCLWAILDPGISYFIELKDEKIEVKSIFGRFNEYKKNEVLVRYALKEFHGRGGTTVSPCLFIGNVSNNEFYFTRNIKYMNSNYCLVILNQKKLQYITDWYRKTIELPDKEKIADICNEFRYYGGKDVGEFYNLIEAYNKRLQEET